MQLYENVPCTFRNMVSFRHASRVFAVGVPASTVTIAPAQFANAKVPRRLEAGPAKDGSDRGLGELVVCHAATRYRRRRPKMPVAYQMPLRPRLMS